MTRVVLLRVLFAVCLLLGCAAAVRAQDEAAPAELADSVSELEFDASQKALLELYNQHKLASAAEVDSEQEAEFDSQLEAEEANMDQLEAEEQSEGQQQHKQPTCRQACVDRTLTHCVLWFVAVQTTPL